MKDPQSISISNSSNTVSSFLIEYGWIFITLISTLYYCYTNQILMRGDMMHYLGISIYMKVSHQYLYPSSYLHHLYLEKPPLIFWLINLGWSLFGVNYWWPQVIASLSILSWAFITKKIYQKIFPNDEQGSRLSPYITLASIGALASQIELRVDWIMVACFLLCINQLLNITQKKQVETHFNSHKKDILILSLIVSIGILCKGPIIYLWILPPCITLRILDKKYKTVLTCALLSSLLGLLIVLATWGASLLYFSPEKYINAMLFKTIMGHATKKNHFEISIFSKLLFISLPWSLNLLFIKRFYRTIQSTHNENPIIIYTLIPILIFFIHGFASWYLLPALPFILILITRFITSNPYSQYISYLNSTVFFTIFTSITLLLLYKSYFHNLTSQHLLFYGYFNPLIFIPLAMACFTTALICLKSFKKFNRFCPLYCSLFIITYSMIQGYGSQQIFKKSNLKNLLSYIQQEHHRGRPIAFYLPKPNSADDIISYIDLFSLKLKNNFATVTPAHLIKFLKKRPNIILIQKDERHGATGCPQGLKSIMKAKASLAYHYSISLCVMPHPKLNKK